MRRLTPAASNDLAYINLPRLRGGLELLLSESSDTIAPAIGCRAQNKPYWQFDMPALIDIDAAAVDLGNISPRTVRRLIADGELQAVKIRGCAPRVVAASIRAYIERQSGAHNPDGAGQALHGARQCQSAQRETKTAFTSGPIHRTGGQAGQAEAAKRLAARLGLK